MVPYLLQKLPSRAVNIRAIETVRYSVIDKKKNEVLEEIEESKAFFQVLTSTYYYMWKKDEKGNLSSVCYHYIIKYIHVFLNSGI